VQRPGAGGPVLYFFGAARPACPYGGETPRLFSTHVYARNAYPQRVPGAQVVCPACLDVMPGRHDFQTMTCRNGHAVGQRGAVSRGTMTCPAGHASKVLDALAGRPPRHEMYAKLVLGAGGRKRYEVITDFAL